MRKVKMAGRYLIPFLLLIVFVQNLAAGDSTLKLLEQLSLNAKEISRMQKGEIVCKKLDTTDKREIAVLGVMLLDVPAEATAEAVRDIKKFKDGKEILGLGKFDRFDPEEMKGLTLEEEEAKALGDCRLQDCDSKLPGAWIEKLSREKDWKKRIQLWKVLLADYAKDYATRGGKAVLDYENTKHPVPAQKEFESVLENSSYIETMAPDFYQYLKEYPEKQPAGTENFVYWSREKFGFKPVVSLTHVSIFKWTHPDFSGYLITSRQIFADHYYNASLGLTILIDRPAQNGKSPGSYIVYINRSRIDMLGGFLSSLRRAITLPRVRNGLEAHMKVMRERIEDKPEKKAVK